MTDDLRARLNAALTAPHALDALERLVGEVTADLRAENERLRAERDQYAVAYPIRHRAAEAAEARVAALETTLANVRALAEEWLAGDGADDADIRQRLLGSALHMVLNHIEAAADEESADGADTTTTDGSGR